MNRPYHAPLDYSTIRPYPHCTLRRYHYSSTRRYHHSNIRRVDDRLPPLFDNPTIRPYQHSTTGRFDGITIRWFEHHQSAIWWSDDSTISIRRYMAPFNDIIQRYMTPFNDIIHRYMTPFNDSSIPPLYHSMIRLFDDSTITPIHYTTFILSLAGINASDNTSLGWDWVAFTAMDDTSQCSSLPLIRALPECRID